eukprot:1791420-Pleurochrysis_carterae.AAC.1
MRCCEDGGVIISAKDLKCSWIVFCCDDTGDQLSPQIVREPPCKFVSLQTIAGSCRNDDEFGRLPNLQDDLLKPSVTFLEDFTKSHDIRDELSKSSVRPNEARQSIPRQQPTKTMEYVSSKSNAAAAKCISLLTHIQDILPRNLTLAYLALRCCVIRAQARASVGRSMEIIMDWQPRISESICIAYAGFKIGSGCVRGAPAMALLPTQRLRLWLRWWAALWSKWFAGADLRLEVRPDDSQALLYRDEQRSDSFISSERRGSIDKEITQLPDSDARSTEEGQGTAEPPRRRPRAKKSMKAIKSSAQDSTWFVCTNDLCSAALLILAIVALF